MKFGRILFIAIIALPVGYCTQGTVRNKIFYSKYETISAGDDKSEVMKKLGKPDVLLRMGESNEIATSKCFEEYIYYLSFVPILPSYPSVCFNERRLVSRTYVYQSP